MRKLQTPRYAIPQHHLTMAGETLQEMSRRLEADAVALATVHTREATLRSAELLKQSKAVQDSADFFFGL